jgi:two-component system LytT family sensor kinase
MSYWICQLCGWGTYTLLKLFIAVAVEGLPWPGATIAIVLLDGAALGLTHWLRGFMRRHRWDELSAGQLAWRGILASFALALPVAIATSLTPIARLQSPEPALEHLPAPFGVDLALLITFSLNLLNWALIFAVWLAIYFTAVGIRQHQGAALRQSELARALQQSELRLLKSQLNPHFLFNALNTVRSLIADDPARAQHAVTHLANTLRYTLGAGQNELVALSRELEIVADFLELEKMRFEERLTLEREIAADAGSAQIPVMLLQTIVENAIKHGIAELPAGGVLRICAVLRDGELVLTVENPRPLTSPRPARAGTGLRNAEERLRLLFDSRATLELDLSQPTRATTRIRIPQHHP